VTAKNRLWQNAVLQRRPFGQQQAMGGPDLLVEVFLWLGSRGHQDLLGVLVAQAKASTLGALESRFLLLGGLLRWLIID
jgi:hypothetical protein